MKKCPKCNNEHSKNGKFCSRSCANSRKFSKESNQKKSDSYKKWLNSLSLIELENVKEKLRCNQRKCMEKKYSKNGCDTSSKKIKLKAKKLKIFICPVSGEEIANLVEYKKRQWSIYPSGKIRTIKLLADTFGVELGFLESVNRLNDIKEMLMYLYTEEELSGRDIHRRFNFKCSESHILNVLKSLGIQRRSFSESTLLSIKNGKSVVPFDPTFKHGWHIDWYGDKHFYRSSYELMFYKKLDDLKLRYETENLRIEYFDSVLARRRIAIPDITVEEIIYEIKSHYFYKQHNMADKFIAYKNLGYDLVLVLDGIEYFISSIDDLPMDR